MSEAAYDLRVHRAAGREMDGLPAEAVAKLKAKLQAASEMRQPTAHPEVEQMKGVDLLKVNGDGIQALCAFDPPEFVVALVDKRRRVYKRTDVALRRVGR